MSAASAIQTFTSGSEMVTRKYRVHIRTGDGLDWSCFRSWNKRQVHFEIVLCRRANARDVSLDKPPNEIGRRGTLLPGKRLELPDDSLWEF